jgi:hypothetical protein
VAEERRQFGRQEEGERPPLEAGTRRAGKRQQSKKVAPGSPIEVSPQFRVQSYPPAKSKGF